MSDVSELLQNSALFQGLPEDVVLRFLEASETQSFKAEEVLAAEGTPVATVYMLTKGTVNAGSQLVNGDHGGSVLSAEAGSFMGLLSIFTEGECISPVSVVASTDVEALVWSTEQWHALCEADPASGYKIALAAGQTFARRTQEWHIAVLNQVAWGLE